MPTSAHAGCTDFTKIPGEFVAAQRADVGIGPYKAPLVPKGSLIHNICRNVTCNVTVKLQTPRST